MNELDQVPEAEWQPFEREAPQEPVKPLRWSIEKYEVAQLLALSRLTLEKISEKTLVPVRVIRSWRKHPEFQAYMDRLVLESAEAMKARRLMLLSKIIDARVEKAEESGDYSFLSNKDTLDVMEALRKETDDQPKEQSRYMKTLETLLEKTQRREIEIQPAKDN